MIPFFTRAPRSPAPSLLIAVTFSACATMRTNHAFDETRELLARVENACMKNIKKNEVLARKECFPLLDDQPIRIKLEKVSVGEFTGTLTLKGYAGATNNQIECEPAEEAKREIEANPAQLKPDEEYIVRGKASEFRNYHSGPMVITIKDCTFKAVDNSSAK